MRILITSSNGFVGQHLIQQFPENIKLYASYHMNKTTINNENCQLIQLDITDSSQVSAVCKQVKPTHVIHLAAITHIPTACNNLQLTWSVNVMGTLNLLRALNQHCPKAFFLYISSGDCYGSSFKQDKPINETSLLQPLNPYACSKAAADLLAYQYAHTSELFIIRARPFNHIGPGQKDSFAIASFAKQIAQIEQGIKPAILNVGNLEVYKYFLDVRDVVDAYLKILLYGKEKLISGEILNICSAQPRKLFQVVKDLMGLSKATIDLQQNKNLLRQNESHVMEVEAPIICKKLGWSPRYRWLDTLGDILDDWRRNIKNNYLGTCTK